MGKIGRADFAEPTGHSLICSIHFSPYCYIKSFMVKMGLRKQSPLLSGAAPTIQSAAATNSSNSCDTRKQPISKLKAMKNRKWLTLLIEGLEELR